MIRLVFLVTFLGLGNVSHAGPITFQFSGQIAQVPIDDIYQDIASGSTVQLTYTFESTSTDQIPDPSSASYLSTGIPFVLTLALPGHLFTADGFVQIGILDSFVDQYTVLAKAATGDLTIEILLQDNSASVFSNDSLPLTRPSLAAFTATDFHFHEVASDGRETQFDGVLSQVTAVPEPSTAIALLGGLGVLVLARSLRRK